MPPGHRRLADWFRDLRNPLHRFLSFRRGVAPADLDDMAQEVFLRLLRYDKAELVTDPAAYLFKVAANVASEWSMRARNRLPHDAAWLADLRAEELPEDHAERALESRLLTVALNSLPSRSREVLRLHFSEEMRHEEIAVHLKVSSRIVKRDLLNAYRQLREALDGSPGATRAEAVTVGAGGKS
jgi:RNA polymerase sigma factor (sigma-70 family)